MKCTIKAHRPVWSSARKDASSFDFSSLTRLAFPPAVRMLEAQRARLNLSLSSLFHGASCAKRRERRHRSRTTASYSPIFLPSSTTPSRHRISASTPEPSLVFFSLRTCCDLGYPSASFASSFPSSSSLPFRSLPSAPSTSPHLLNALR